MSHSNPFSTARKAPHVVVSLMLVWMAACGENPRTENFDERSDAEPSDLSPQVLFDVSVADPLVPIYPDQDPPTLSVRELDLDAGLGIALTEVTDAARGTWATLHLVLDQAEDSDAPEQPIDLNDLSIEVVSRATSFEVYELIPVPVEENTGLQSRTEIFERRRNPHVIREAPFSVYEVASPVPVPERTPANRRVIQVRWWVAPEVKPGRYSMAIRIFDADKPSDLGTNIEWPIRVSSVTVPPPSSETLDFTNWIDPNRLADFHDVPRWSPAHWKLIEQTARLTAELRQNVINVPINAMFILDPEGEWQLDITKLGRWIAIFAAASAPDHEIQIEIMPPLARPDRDWASPELVMAISGRSMETEAGQTAFRRLLARLNLIEELFADTEIDIARILMHIADEPTDTNAVAYAEAAAIVRQIMPEAEIFDATLSTDLVGSIDAWCPQVHRWAPRQDFFAERASMGESVWVYTCLEPGGPWMNRMLDMERTRMVYLAWGCALFELDGILHWAMNTWMDDPYEKSVVLHPGDRTGRNRLPAGDSHLIYPGVVGPDGTNTGPLRGVRFDACRTGMEDHALLMQLQAIDPVEADTLIRKIVRGFDDFDADVAAYREARRELLLRLEIAQD